MSRFKIQDLTPEEIKREKPPRVGGFIAWCA